MSNHQVNTVSVLFFGATADITGQRKVDLEVPPDSHAQAAFDKVLEKYPRLSNHKLLFSINQKYSSGEETVCDGDELALFTAVSGG